MNNSNAGDKFRHAVMLRIALSLEVPEADAWRHVQTHASLIDEKMRAGDSHTNTATYVLIAEMGRAIETLNA